MHAAVERRLRRFTYNNDADTKQMPAAAVAPTEIPATATVLNRV